MRLFKKLKPYRKKGTNNKIIVIKNNKERVLLPFEKVNGLKVDIIGNNNTIILEEPFHFTNVDLLIYGDSCLFHIKKNSRIIRAYIRLRYGENMKFEIGKNFTANSMQCFIEDRNCINIKNDCMFADNVRLWATDSHVIFDPVTGELLNDYISTLTIGNKCWLGHDAVCLKNAVLPDNTIVGFGSIVTKKFAEEYTALGGNPAKVIKEGVTWSRATNYIYKKSLNL